MATEKDSATIDGAWTLYEVSFESQPTARKQKNTCLLYTSDAADERSSVDLGGRRIITKKKKAKKKKKKSK